MKKRKATLVIDQGGHSSRAIVFDEHYSILTLANEAVSTDQSQAGFVEQSPQGILTSVRQSIEQSLNHLPSDVVIHHAALIAQRSSFIAVQRSSGACLTPVISWQDTRGSSLMDTWDIESIRKLTGLRANAHYGASKMAWLLENDVTVKEAYQQKDLVFLPLGAWLAKELTTQENYLCEHGLASRTLLMDVHQLQWSETLMAMAQVEKHALPQLVDSIHDHGHIKALDLEVPLRLTGGDQSFLSFVKGELQPGELMVNAGTGAFVLSLAPDEDKRLLYSLCATKKQKAWFLVEGTVNNAGSALSWFLNREGVKLEFSEIDNILQNNLTALSFKNTLAGSGSPDWLPACEPEFSAEGSFEEKLVAVFQAVVDDIVKNIEAIKAVHPSVKTITLTGGFSRLKGFREMLQERSGFPVRILLHKEASALGAARFVGMH